VAPRQGTVGAETKTAEAPSAAPSEIDCCCLAPHQLEAFLERRRASPSFVADMSLADNLTAVLRKANEFVPSEAGSILLDNPKSKESRRAYNRLTFIAAFGTSAAMILGRRISAEEGIAGHVYRTGESYATSSVADDKLFFPLFDRITNYSTRSLVAIPIRIEQEVCGVLELINRRHRDGFGRQDLNLLEIFAGFISISIQNVLDGRQAQEIAKRDNLTGLFNDRYLHISLARAIETCRATDKDLTLLFLDLDFFKHVNDTHGHLAGSQVLQEVGLVLRRECDGLNAIVARYGGDEFVLALLEMDLEAGVDLAESIRERIVSNTFCSSPGEIQPDALHLTGLTCSIGVASLSRHLRHEDSTERCKSTLLRLSDSAMYVAKETGRNRTAVAGELVQRRTPAG
jgi:diguanylate cyclase (GGDEF)-like protein